MRGTGGVSRGCRGSRCGSASKNQASSRGGKRAAGAASAEDVAHPFRVHVDHRPPGRLGAFGGERGEERAQAAGSARNSSGSTTTAHWPAQNWSSIWSRQRRTARVSRIAASASGG